MEPETALRSRRALNLRFDIPIARTKEFWDSLRKGVFVTTKCSKCGNVTFPPQADCPKCMGNEFTWLDLGRDGSIVTYTHVMVAPASFSGSDHYTVAITELPAGVRVLAWLEGVQPEKVKTGMKVRIEAREAGGNPYYVFVPA